MPFFFTCQKADGQDLQAFGRLQRRVEVQPGLHISTERHDPQSQEADVFLIFAAVLMRDEGDGFVARQPAKVSEPPRCPSSAMT